MEMLTVGQVAQTFGETVRTLHHYDEVGLLSPSERTRAAIASTPRTTWSGWRRSSPTGAWTSLSTRWRPCSVVTARRSSTFGASATRSWTRSTSCTGSSTRSTEPWRERCASNRRPARTSRRSLATGSRTSTRTRRRSAGVRPTRGSSRRSARRSTPCRTGRGSRRSRSSSTRRSSWRCRLVCRRRQRGDGRRGGAPRPHRDVVL